MQKGERESGRRRASDYRIKICLKENEKSEGKGGSVRGIGR